MADDSKLDMNFLALIMAHQQAGLQKLGKVADPETGEIERDLPAVQGAIAFLEMIERKTRGNLAREEEQVLQESLTFLRLNYVEEMRSERTSSSSDGKGSEETPAK